MSSIFTLYLHFLHYISLIKSSITLEGNRFPKMNSSKAKEFPISLLINRKHLKKSFSALYKFEIHSWQNL